MSLVSWQKSIRNMHFIFVHMSFLCSYIGKAKHAVGLCKLCHFGKHQGSFLCSNIGKTQIMLVFCASCVIVAIIKGFIKQASEYLAENSANKHNQEVQH